MTDEPMSAQRWNMSDLDIANLLNLDSDLVDRLLLLPIIPQVIQSEAEAEISAEDVEREAQIPAVLPILPLRGLVVYPQTVVPLTIGQPRSIRMVDDVVAGEERL
ncbi:MAG TPA: LON peptidase substrate-binding domain-containing protein, partial [Anaerolineales bacterium]|nr:LON peptidase substrate-binding domain-containing protein [Anaerolineales bacterium]